MSVLNCWIPIVPFSEMLNLRVKVGWEGEGACEEEENEFQFQHTDIQWNIQVWWFQQGDGHYSLELQRIVGPGDASFVIEAMEMRKISLGQSLGRSPVEH